jgi:hypothetical protein
MSTKDWRSSSGTSTVAAMAWISSRSSGTQPASRIPLGELDAGQPGGYFDGQVEAGAPALDEERQGGGGLDIRKRVVHTFTHVLIMNARP